MALLLLILRYGVDTIYSDQWELVPLIRKTHESGLDLSVFWAPHGEQRMFLPRLIMLGLGVLTGWNIKAELLLNLLFAACVYAVLLLLARRSLGQLGVGAYSYAVVLSVVMFSPVQWENWLWGWQISWWLPLMVFVLGTALLALWPPGRPAWQAVAASAVLAVTGQLSLFSGTLFWLAALPILAVRKSLRRYIWVWLAAGGIATAIYLYRYDPHEEWTQYHSGFAYLRDNLGSAIKYVLTFLGAPLWPASPAPVAAAIVLVFVAAAGFLIATRRENQMVSAWIAIGLYCLGVAVVNMFGRLRLGLEWAQSSRYSTMGIMLLAVTCVLTGMAMARGDSGTAEPVMPARAEPAAGRQWVRPRSLVPAVMLALVGVVFVSKYPRAIQDFRSLHQDRLVVKQCLHSVESPQDPCLLKTYPNGPVAFDRVTYLRKIGWAGLKNHRDS